MTPRDPRHNQPSHRPGQARRLAGAFAALFVLIAVVGGVPVLMGELHLVPHALPAWGQVTHALTSRDTGQLVVIILAAGIWLCWALFTLSLVGEILAAARRRPTRLLPGLAVFQRPAAALVAAIVIGLTIAPTIGGVTVALASAPPAATQIAHPATHPLTHSGRASQEETVPRAAAAVAGPAYLVQQRDTLWGIAERTLGDPLRYPEILTLNPARIGPDNEIIPGTVLTLPAGATVAPAPTPAVSSDNYGAVRVSVQPGDTLSEITQRLTGDAALYPEVAAANDIADPDLITPGQVITIPANLTTHPTPAAGVSVTVQPGDTLSSITQRVTGDGDQWPTTWHANAGRPEPGGTHFTDPDEIYAGWTITIPTPHRPATNAAPPHPAPPHTPTPSTTGHPAATPTTGHTPENPPAATPSDPLHPAAAPNHPAVPAAGSTAATPPVTTAPAEPAAPSEPVNAATSGATLASAPPTAPAYDSATTIGSTLSPANRAAPAANPAPAANSAPATHGASVAFTAGGGVLLAGVSLTALLAYRRAQFRRRRPGRMIATAPADTVPLERALVQVGAGAQPNVTMLDHALRGLAQLAADADRTVPDVIAASLTIDGLTLVLASPDDAPPAPWEAHDAGTRWTIRRDAPTNYREERREYSLAPYPALVSVGYTDTGDEWLLDLERIGALSLVGDLENSLNLARFLAAELAHNTWSEMLTVTMVGFGAELVPANPDRLTHTDNPAAAIESAAALLDTPPGATVLQGRAGPNGDSWAPHVLLIAPNEHPDTASDLNDLRAAISAQTGRSCVCLVTIAAPDNQADGWEMGIEIDGQLTVPALGLCLRAQQIPEHEAAQLAQMLAIAAEADDTPCPPAEIHEPCDDDTDAYGALTLSAAARPTNGRAELHLADTRQPNSLLPLPDNAYLASAAVVAADLDAIAPIVDEQIRARVEAADPHLDDDLADWHDPDCPRPRITVLGVPTVRANGELPIRSPQVRANTEAVVYLATQAREGVSSTVFAETMWPEDPDVAGKSKVKNMIWAVRNWLGKDPHTGKDYLPDGRNESGHPAYRLHGAILDADLFRRLRKRGMASGADGIADLTKALGLVSGLPFAGITERRNQSDRGPGGWLWMTQANTRLDLDYTGMIVDTAHTLATHHLATGHPTRAAEALRAGLTAGSYDDILLLDLLQACHAQGLTGEAAAWEAQLRVNYEGAELPQRTAEILHRLLGHDPAHQRVRAG